MPLSSLRILKLHLEFPEMSAPITDRRRSDGRYWTMTIPERFKERMLDTSRSFAQVLKPNLRQVWHFLYAYCELQWRVYDIARVQVDATNRVKVELMKNKTYNINVREWSLSGLSKSCSDSCHILVVVASSAEVVLRVVLRATPCSVLAKLNCGDVPLVIFVHKSALYKKESSSPLPTLSWPRMLIGIRFSADICLSQTADCLSCAPAFERDCWGIDDEKRLLFRAHGLSSSSFKLLLNGETAANIIPNHAHTSAHHTNTQAPSGH